MRLPNKSGGGANTNKVGLRFERTTSIQESLIKKGYNIVDHQVLKKGKLIAELYPKHALYNILFKARNHDYKKIISKRLLPDQGILINNNFFILEVKFQGGSGSVDEKLQTCHFKKRQYEKLLKPLGLQIQFIYVLSDWFKRPEYKDVLEYIKEVGCQYVFNEIPLNVIGL
jgi:hypothetical protein